MSGNLPKPTTAFVGRTQELETIHTRFSSGQRLITILGPGGAGKTRLASEYGRQFESDYPGGVWFFELTPFRNGMEALEAARIEFNILDSGGQALKAIATQIETDGPALFIVDNLEHLAEDFAASVSSFMKLSPNTQIIATSREPLHVIGEYQIRLGALLPDDAVQLFSIRAASHVPDFRLDTASTGAVLELADRVDYLPLAIELAASRVSLLSPANLVERLTHRMSALKSRERDRPERHQTIAATIEWSWELLTPELQEALLDLSPMQSSFTLAEAEAILVGDALELISSLLDYSMLERVGEDRFRVLGTVKGFAHVRLMDSERGHEVVNRYASYYSECVLSKGRQAAVGKRAFLGNLRAAARNEMVLDALRARSCVACAWILNESDGVSSILDSLEQVSRMKDIEPELVAEALLFRAIHFYEERRLDLSKELALAAKEATTDLNLRLRAESVFSLAVAASGALPEALRRLEEALVQAKDAEPHVQMIIRGNLSMVAFSTGEMQRGTDLLAENLLQAETLKDPGIRARTLTNLGVASVAQGRDDEARRYFRDAARLLEELGDIKFQAVALAALADLERHAGNAETAIPLYARALELSRSGHLTHIELRALAGRASLYIDAEDRGYLVQALERVEDESETVDAQTIRTQLFLFDLWFENDPLARHQGRQILELKTLPNAWKAVIAATMGISYAIRQDVEASAKNFALATSLQEGTFDAAYVSAAIQLARCLSDSGATSPMPAIEALNLTSPAELAIWPRQEVVRVLRELARRYAPQSAKPVLRITADGRKFIAPGESEVIDFTRRGALRMILVGLAELRRDHAGTGISLDEVLEMGWPGEHVTPEAAASRVYTAIRTLRGFGLDDYLLTTDQGYLFSTDLDVSFEDL